MSKEKKGLQSLTNIEVAIHTYALEQFDAASTNLSHDAKKKWSRMTHIFQQEYMRRELHKSMFNK